jgi:hypothetical protein
MMHINPVPGHAFNPSPAGLRIETEAGSSAAKATAGTPAGLHGVA